MNIKKKSTYPKTECENMNLNQQDFLREAATTLELTQKGLAERMGAPWPTFEKWLLPKESPNSREMPQIAWTLVREILAHEKLKAQRVAENHI